MNKFNSVVSMSALVLAVGASFASTDAQAVTQSRNFVTNPTGICQAALPAFEGAIRKRPLAVQNEGTTSAFVTCSFTNQTAPTSTTVWFASSDSVAHAVSCTGVSGFNTGANQFIVKTATAPASGAQTSLTWSAADFSGAPATFPSSRFSISCNLVPGLGINDSSQSFNEDVGA